MAMRQGTQSRPLGIWAVCVIFLSVFVIEVIDLTKSIPGFNVRSQLETAGLVLTLLKLICTALFVYSLFSLRKSSLLWLACIALTALMLAILQFFRDEQVLVILVWNQLVLFVVYIVVFVYLYLFKKKGALD
jgi:hypothetical protein